MKPKVLITRKIFPEAIDFLKDHTQVEIGISNGKLTKEEFDVIKCHSYYTYYIIHSISGLKHISEWAAFHHEKLDGSGYPFHCCSINMNIGSRIMPVADIFTALIEDRPYRKGMSKDQVIKIFNELSSDNLLDDRIIAILIDNYSRISDYVKTVQESAIEFYNLRFKNIA